MKYDLTGAEAAMLLAMAMDPVAPAPPEPKLPGPWALPIRFPWRLRSPRPWRWTRRAYRCSRLFCPRARASVRRYCRRGRL